MAHKLSLYVKIFLACGSLYLISSAVSQEIREHAGYRDLLLDYLDRHSTSEPLAVIEETGPNPPYEPPAKGGSSLEYGSGDWGRYVIEPRYRLLLDRMEAGDYSIEEKDDIDLNTFGTTKLDLTYGKSRFTKKKYKQSDQDKPVSQVIKSGYRQSNDMQMHIEGHIGERLTVYIDHDKRKKDNQYRVKYRAVNDDEVIREINAGEIDIKMKNSKYVVYDDTSSKGLGMDVTLKKDRLQVKAFGSVTKGETVVESFRGNSTANNVSLGEYQYIRGVYYQLEAFRRYDNLTAPPSTPQFEGYDSLITFSSNPPNPQSYVPYSVNIDAAGFELYMDDQNSLNNTNGFTLGLDGGYYARMVSGSDYTINYTTGVITMLRTVPANARIFAVYTHDGGGVSSSDPAARTDVVPFAGRIFVFIKYGYSINEDLDRDLALDAGEDRNGDGKLNLDIYEIRSFYYVGEQQLIQDNFKLQFLNNGRVMTKNDTARLGTYTVNYTKGVIGFRLREPFKPLLPAASAAAIYTENQSSTLSETSAYRMRIDYYREARSFQLKHTNIIPDSVRVRINGKELKSSLYSVDHTSGYLAFVNPNNPVIGPETQIEVKYEYLPFAGGSKSFVGGLRADYELMRDMNIGGTFLYSRSATSDIIPIPGNEPTQTMVLEADATMDLGAKRLQSIINALPGVAVGSVPFDIKIYGEYAHSYKNINTFGKALVDDMESTEEVVIVSLSDRDWMLSSMPTGFTQAERGRLYYRYYRDPVNADSLKTILYPAAALDYSIKPGPYNIAAGHIDATYQSQDSQRSLVFEYEFAAGERCIPVVTRRLSSGSVDFSGLQYVEIWYRSEGMTGNVDIHMDLGRINEDGDGDGIYETEDTNLNGFLDYDISTGLTEDKGYIFDGNYPTIVGGGPKLNSYTVGDGVLTSEDLNGNGMLDTAESVVRIEGDITKGPVPAIANVTSSNYAWTMKRIYINRNSADFKKNVELLKQVESVRIFLQGAAGGKGKIYIDSIRFVSSRWRNIKLDDIQNEDPSYFSVTVVNTVDDIAYRVSSFIMSNRDLYKSFYGDKKDSELVKSEESALQIDYNFTEYTMGSVTRKFLKSMDLRFYKTLNLWVNYRSSSAVTKMAVRLGSSDSDYLYYEFTKDFENIWREVRLSLSGSGSGIKSLYSVGVPDLKRINYMELIVYSGGSGQIWFDEFYVSDPETKSDSAHWVEAEVRGKRALYYTSGGVPVISDIYIKYIDKGNGANFSSIGKTTAYMMERYRQLFTSVQVLPNWNTQVDFIFENSRTDSLNTEVVETKRGRSEKSTLYVESDYVSDIPAVPSIKLVYKKDDYENLRDEYVSSFRINRKSENRIQSPSIIMRERIDGVFGGQLNASFNMDMVFKEENITRKSNALSPLQLEQFLSTSEREKRQKGNTQLDLEYRHKYFFIRPVFALGSQEIVTLKGRSTLSDTSIVEEMGGGFHFPFVYHNDLKFVERNKKTTIRLGGQGLGVFSPTMRMEFYYFENNFGDYTTYERLYSGRYERSRDARSFASSNLTLPFDFTSKRVLGFVKNMTLSYTRSCFLQETDVPYEGEGYSTFEERYGLNRGLNGVSRAGLNLFRYPPWYFFVGRGNYSNGRDYAYRHLNRKPDFPSGSAVPDYTNNLRVIDNYALTTNMDLEKFVLNLSSALNQVSERAAVNGMPQQVVSMSSNMNIVLDLMRIFSFGFFRSNRIGEPYHSASLTLGYNFSRNMTITSNINQYGHMPEVGLVFKRDRASLALRFGYEFRHRSRLEFISSDYFKRDRRDDVYVSNMQTVQPFREVDRGYVFSALYETDVHWMYDLFSSFYKLVAFPIFSLEYSMILNRYNYTYSTSPEPYDRHMFASKLTLDLHKNVQGGVSGRCAYEKYHRRSTAKINREIISYDFGLNFSLIF